MWLPSPPPLSARSSPATGLNWGSQPTVAVTPVAAAVALAVAAVSAGPVDRMTQPIIQIEQLVKIFSMGENEVHALDGVTFSIEKGEMIAIMGPSGSGKSTLMSIVGCLDVATSGTYILDEISVEKMNDTQLADVRGRKIGFVFQQFNLLSRTSALENVLLPLSYTGLGSRASREKALHTL